MKNDLSQVPSPNRRRQFIVNRQVQYAILGFSVGMALLAIVIIFLQNRVALSMFLDPDFRALLGDSALLGMIEEGRHKATIAVALFSVLILVLMMVGGIYLSNRIVGPIYRLQKHMEATLKGQPQPPLTFREGDFFKELLTHYNSIVERFRSK